MYGTFDRNTVCSQVAGTAPCRVHYDLWKFHPRNVPCEGVIGLIRRLKVRAIFKSVLVLVPAFPAASPEGGSYFVNVIKSTHTESLLRAKSE